MKQLVEIACVIRDRDLANLSAKMAAMRLAAQQRADFAKATRAEKEAMTKVIGYRKEYELSRETWVERQLYSLSHFEARTAALVESQKLVAAKTFGRATVLEKLVERGNRKR